MEAWEQFASLVTNEQNAPKDESTLVAELNEPRLAWKSMTRSELLGLISKHNLGSREIDWESFIAKCQENPEGRIRFSQDLADFFLLHTNAKEMLAECQESYTLAFNYLEREAKDSDVIDARKMAVDYAVVKQQEEQVKETYDSAIAAVKEAKSTVFTKGEH